MLKVVLDLAKRRIDDLERTCAQYETRLRDELRPLGGIVAHMAHPSWATDIDMSRTYYVNAAYTRWFASSDAHESSETAPGLLQIHPADRARVVRGRRPIAGDPDSEYEFRVLNAAGDTQWLRERVSVVTDRDGRPMCHVGVAVDITGYKQLEERVALVRQTLSVIQPAMFATDLDGRIRYWSTAAERLFGWSAAEAETQRARDVLELLEQRGQEVGPDSPGNRAKVGPAELHVRRPDGTSCWVSLSGAPLLDAAQARAGMLYVATDLSALRQLEDRVVRQQA